MTSRPGKLGVAAFAIKASGASVADDVRDAVAEIVVDARLRVPDHLTLRMRDDHGDVMAGIDLALDMVRDVADAVDGGDGGAAEFHHKAAHDAWCIP